MININPVITASEKESEEIQKYNIISICVNIATLCIICYFIYNFIKNYKKELEYQQNHITSYNEIENYIIEYSDTDICKTYQSLTDRDKEFLTHLINSKRIQYKEDKSGFSKQFRFVKSQLFFNIIITFLLSQNINSVIESFKRGSLFAFFNTL